MERKKKILFVDDTDAFLIILNKILMDDYETMSAIDGEDGLETARATMPDLILLDLIMPGMSGYEVLEALKADDVTKHIPVILMSAGKPSNHKGATLGAAGYLQKPFQAHTLKNAIESVLSHQN
jgi:putative two-component system response regulator